IPAGGRRGYRRLMAAASRLISRVPLADLIVIPVLGALLMIGTHWAGVAQGPAPHPTDLLGYLLMGSAVASLVVRRVWPVPVLAVSAGAIVAYIALGYSYGPIVFLPCLALYTVAAWQPVRRSAVADGFALLAIMGVVVVRQVVTGPSGISLDGV